MIELGPDETLDVDSAVAPGEGASTWPRSTRPYVAITGDPEPDLMGDLDPSRVGRARMIELSKLSMKHTVQRVNNWTIVSSPNEGWAEKVFGEPDVERLWEAVAYTVRLDEEDPVAAWEAHREHWTTGRRGSTTAGSTRCASTGPAPT